MKYLLLGSAVVFGTLSFGSFANACDMHGDGFGGYAWQNAGWTPYTPRVSPADSFLAEDDMLSPLETTKAKAEKPKPSFSNVASRASEKAMVRIAEKDKDVAPETSDKNTTVKKASLEANR